MCTRLLLIYSCIRLHVFVLYMDGDILLRTKTLVESFDLVPRAFSKSKMVLASNFVDKFLAGFYISNNGLIFNGIIFNFKVNFQWGHTAPGKF